MSKINDSFDHLYPTKAALAAWDEIAVKVGSTMSQMEKMANEVQAQLEKVNIPPAAVQMMKLVDETTRSFGESIELYSRNIFATNYYDRIIGHIEVYEGLRRTLNGENSTEDLSIEIREHVNEMKTEGVELVDLIGESERQPELIDKFIKTTIMFNQKIETVIKDQGSIHEELEEIKEKQDEAGRDQLWTGMSQTLIPFSLSVPSELSNSLEKFFKFLELLIRIVYTQT
ncbi:hypothetical protein [Halalkalibacterium halodurans]|uniref:hypothetical protein n=1 Tax=Halalkalibacterium halodurans TaxID=86665 RepID=UPI002AAA5A79|nr:hypothetical protein [Halalkalibacterium halodurans]MDY7224646.1 hypothetical protein [Halalkalibacterium halodurans]MDY7243247.1 hypothetical protein [Halalkalibacterium halodurans]